MDADPSDRKLIADQRKIGSYPWEASKQGRCCSLECASLILFLLDCQGRTSMVQEIGLREAEPAN